MVDEGDANSVEEEYFDVATNERMIFNFKNSPYDVKK